jgi:hypothetical protein
VIAFFFCGNASPTEKYFFVPKSSRKMGKYGKYIKYDNEAFFPHSERPRAQSGRKLISSQEKLHVLRQVLERKQAIRWHLPPMFAQVALISQPNQNLPHLRQFRWG